MITVFDHQNIKTGGRDILVINGELSEYRSTEEQRIAQGLTIPNGDMKKQEFFSWYFRKKGVSPYFSLYHKKHIGVIMTSNLFSKDESGRRLSYSFFCDRIDDPVFARKLFEDYCSIASVIPDPKDTKALEKFLRFQKNKRKYIVTGLLVFAILILLLLI